jgi:SAM-dependent methyltransferase
MDNFFRGTNIKDKWERKHIQEYDLDKPFDFTVFEGEDMLGYGSIGAKILEENKDVFNLNSLHELGCGNGAFVAYVKQYVLTDWDISAEDFSKPAIETAIQKCPSVTYYINDFLLNRIDKDYGCICLFETIEHIEEGTNYKILDNILDHCEYAIISTVDTEDDCFGEHISHYKIDTFEEKGYDVIWKSFLSEIQMPDGIYHYMIFLLKGNLG